jgi:hypothetical protein
MYYLSVRTHITPPGRTAIFLSEKSRSALPSGATKLETIRLPRIFFQNSASPAPGHQFKTPIQSFGANLPP